MKRVIMTTIVALAICVCFLSMGIGMAIAEETPGWVIYAPEGDEELFEFDANGNIANIWAADGNVGSQWTNMYAMRQNAKALREDYSVEATFTPDSESTLSAERTYGLVAWYVDEGNYLIYWMQQKTDGGWSGQFYGKVNNASRQFALNDEATGWNTSEWNDMWWDNASVAHPELVGKRDMILTETITMKVVSSVVTHTGTNEECRKFELHIIYKDADFVSSTYWVPGTVKEDIYAGVYANTFNVAISNFGFYGANDAEIYGVIAEEVGAIGETMNNAEIAKIIAVRAKYDALIELKKFVTEETVTALVNAETAAAAYIDGVIEALDATKSSFKEDVLAASAAYDALNDYISGKVTKHDALLAAIQTAETWTDPNVPDPDLDPDPDPEDDGAGCNCAQSSIGGIFSMITLAAAGVYVFTRKH